MSAASAGKGYALKFISGKYQGGEFPLKLDKQIVIGRSSELDMVLVEDMVSRKHAKISVAGGKIVIEDLGSTNGTFVNGEKIRQARLKEGDRILIGTSILKLVQARAGSSPDEGAARVRLEEAAASQAARSAKTSMTGKIEEVPLPDLLQLFHTSKKNGVLVVSGEHQAKIYLRQGKVFFAVIGGHEQMSPSKAFNRILTWETGDFELRPPDGQSFSNEMSGSTEALLMDALRQLDEYRRLEPELPRLDEGLALPAPMTPPLHALEPDQLDVLQLVHNHGSLAGVLDHADKDDAATAQALLFLLKKGYVCKQ